MALLVFTTSCGVLGGGNANGSVNGQASGAALKSLYTQYKTDGRVDLTNLNNIISMAQLVNGIQGLKNVEEKSKFYGDFAAGLTNIIGLSFCFLGGIFVPLEFLGEGAKAIGRFVSGLPKTEKNVFVLRYWYVAPIDDIAEKLGFSKGKVKTILFRARKKLKNYLEEEGLC